MKALNPYYSKQDGPHPKFYRDVNPGNNKHSNLVPVVAGIIVAAIGAAATATSVIINSQSAKKQQQRQKEAQEELLKLQAQAALAVNEQKANANKQYFIYAIIAIVVLGAVYFFIKKKT